MLRLVHPVVLRGLAQTPFPYPNPVGLLCLGEGRGWGTRVRRGWGEDGGICLGRWQLLACIQLPWFPYPSFLRTKKPHRVSAD
jgi:hypothetical protein